MAINHENYLTIPKEKMHELNAYLRKPLKLELVDALTGYETLDGRLVEVFPDCLVLAGPNKDPHSMKTGFVVFFQREGHFPISRIYSIDGKEIYSNAFFSRSK